MRDDPLAVAAAQQPIPATIEQRTLTPPAAGSDFTIVVPGSEAWRLLAITFQLVTSAAVANRWVRLAYDNQGADSARVGAAALQAATNTVVYSFARHLGNWGPTGLATEQWCPLPDIVLSPGWRLHSLTALLDVADQFNNIRFTIERLDHPPMTQGQRARLYDAQERGE